MNVWTPRRPGSAFWLWTQVVKHSVTVTSGGIISQLFAMLPSIQSAECVCHEGTTWSTENTVYLGLWIYSWPSAFLLWWEFGLVEPSTVWISTAYKSYITSWAQTRLHGQYWHSSETQKGCGEPSLFHFHPQEAASSSRQRWAIFL